MFPQLPTINQTYEDQLWDPDNWTVLSFHNNTGTALANDVLVADSITLKTAGSLTVDTVISDLCPPKIIFARVRTNFDFSHLNGCTVQSSLNTFIQLPQATCTVHNGIGGTTSYRLSTVMIISLRTPKKNSGGSS